MRTITSRTNDLVKQARALQQAKVRHEQGLHLAESDKLVREALSSGAAICRLFVEEGHALPEAADLNLHTAPPEITGNYRTLPETREKAASLAESSAFIQEHLPKAVIQGYCR